MVLCVVALLWLLAIAALALFGKPGQARAMSRFLPDLVVLFKGLLTDNGFVIDKELRIEGRFLTAYIVMKKALDI